MAKTPIESAVESWNTIAQTAAQQGVPVANIKQLGQADINKVAQGGSAMSKEEALSTLLASAGRPPITPPQRKTGPLDVIGNIPHDLTDTLKGFLPGLGHFLAHLPSETTTTFQELTNEQYAKAHGFENAGYDLHGLAAALRNVSRMPLASLLPGVHTAAELTTSSGRKDLERHPIGTALDVGMAVLPVAKAAGVTKLSEAGLLSDTGTLKSAVEEADQKVADTPLADRTVSRATVELSKGHFGKAIIKSLEDNTAYGQFAKSLGIDTETIATKMKLIRGTAITRAKYERQATARSAEIWQVLQHIPADEHTQLFRDIEAGIRDPIDPNKQAVFDLAKRAAQEAQHDFVDEGSLTPLKVAGKTVYYSSEGDEGKVLSAINAAHRYHDFLSAARSKLQSQESVSSRLVDQIHTKHDERAATLSRMQARAQTAADNARQRLQEYRDYGGGPKLDKLKELRLINDATAAESRVERIKGLTGLNEYRRRARVEATNQRPALLDAKALVDRRLRSAHAANFHAIRRVLTTAPAEYHPLLQQELADRISAKLGIPIDQSSLSGALRDINNDKYPGFTPDDLTALKTDIQSGWTNLVRDGYDPVYLHHVDVSRFGKDYVRVLSDHPFPLRQVRARVFGSMEPHIENTGVALSHAAVERLSRQAVLESFENFLLPAAQDLNTVMSDVEPAVLKSLKTNGWMGKEAVLSKTINDRWVRLDPTDLEQNFGIQSAKLSSASSKALYVPKEVYNTFRQLTDPVRIPFGDKLQKLNNAYKVSLFTLSVKHFSHIVLGGFTALMGRGGIEDITSALQAWRMVKDGNLPEEIPQTLDITSVDQMVAQMQGSKAAKILSDIHGKLGALERTETFLQNVERAMSYLGELKRTGNHELALKHVEKTFIDWYGMTPIERTVIKQIFPFYAFTKYAMRYVLSYPIDHPYRASILHNMAMAEQSDWNSGLPQQWQQLFFFGHPNSQGNITAFDIRSINPFRDIANNLSLAGFFSGLGPFAKIPLDTLGVNTLTGTPELYPEITYDPLTGKMVAKRVPSSTTAIKGLEDVLPPVNILDHFLGLSQNIRRLKAADPAAYQRQIFSVLNLPFDPGTYNLPATESKTEQALFKIAQADISQSERTGQFSESNRFNLVPFQGRLIDPHQLQTLLNQISGRLPKGSKIKPKAVLTRPNSRRSSVPVPPSAPPRPSGA